MKQVWIPKIGAPEVLEVREAPDPEPSPGQVRVQVRASGVNFADVMARMGLYPDAPKLPAVVGYEVAGVIDAVGEGVGSLSVGQRVVALTRFGGYSSVVVVPAEQIVVLPDSLSFEQCASLPVNWLTAWLMLVHLGNVREGDKVLIHAAAGGVGLAAVQICRWKGAEIFGTASASKHERLKTLGVAHTIDYRTQDFEAEVKRITNGEGVTIVLDAVGGESYKKSYRCLEHLGRLYMFGVSSMAPGKKRSVVSAVSGLMKMGAYRPIPLMNNNRGVHGVNLGHLWHKGELMTTMLRTIVDLVAQGTFETHVDQTFPLEEAAQAHRYIQDRKNFGKVLLVCPS